VPVRIYLRRLAWPLAWVLPVTLFLEPVRSTIQFGQRRVLAVLALAVAAGGCTPAKMAPPPSARSPEPAVGGAAPAADSTAPAAGSAMMPRSIRCGEPAGAYLWRLGPEDVVAGPLKWPGLKLWATADPAQYGYHDAAGFHYKVGAELKAGSPVTVTIAPEARG
jgi:hypothetical protein